MLYIYTDKKYIKGRQCVDDIENYYSLRKNDIIERYEHDSTSLKVLERIEGMTEHKKSMIMGKFGAVALDNISTGGKGCLIATLYHDSIALSTDEMGYNCIYLLFELSKEMDIIIYSSIPYNYVPDGVRVNVNNVEVMNSDEIIEFMEVCYEQ